MQRGQAFDTFKLLIAGVVAVALLAVILSVIGGVGELIPSGFDATKASITDFAVYPRESTPDTIFTVKGTVKMKEGKITRCQQPARVFARIDEIEVEMYDDGKHNDRKSRDCVFGGLWNSEGKDNGNYTVKMFARDSTGIEIESDETSFSINNNACALISGEGQSEKKLDIVFVGHDYNDLTIFDSDVEIHSSFLLDTVPFNEYTDRINILSVRQLTDFGCEIDGGIINCQDDEIARVASQCPFDEIIVLVNTDAKAGSANPHAYAGRLYPEITVHEFGHSFGPEPINLADEYSYDQSLSEAHVTDDYPNCDFLPCTKWSHLSGTLCVNIDKYGRQGCSYTEWFKPANYDPDRNFPIMEGASMKERNDPFPPKPVEHDAPSIEFIRSLLEEFE